MVVNTHIIIHEKNRGQFTEIHVYYFLNTNYHELPTNFHELFSFFAGFRICLDFTVNMFFMDFSAYLRLFLASLPSRFLQIDYYLLHPESANLLKNSSQLNSK